MAAGAERAKKSFLIPNCSYFSLCLAGWLRQPEISPSGTPIYVVLCYSSGYLRMSTRQMPCA